MTYTLPEPASIRSYGQPYAEGYTADQMHEAYTQGQRDMREAAARVIELELYNGSDIAVAIRALPLEELK